MHQNFWKKRIPKTAEKTLTSKVWFIFSTKNQLLEVNRLFYQDPTSSIYEPQRLRWKSGPALVQVSLLSNNRLSNNWLIYNHLSDNHLSDNHLSDNHLSGNHLSNNHLSDNHLSDLMTTCPMIIFL
jgi:hypothetical protein